MMREASRRPSCAGCDGSSGGSEVSALIPHAGGGIIDGDAPSRPMSYAGGSRLCTRVAFHGVCGLASCAAVAAICSAQHGSGRVPPITDAGGGAITTRVGAKGCVGECRSGVADDGTAMRGGHGSGGGSRDMLPLPACGSRAKNSVLHLH